MEAQSGDGLAFYRREGLVLRKAASTRGGEYAGACPWCGGRDRFRVWAGEGRYWCRQCERKGDAIQYARDRYGLGYLAACAYVNVTPRPRDGVQPAAAVPAHESSEPPSDAWQARAIALGLAAADRLWAPEGSRALAWLQQRGLTIETIRAASLGFHENPACADGDLREDPAAWGLPVGHSAVWAPRGITIPWQSGGHLWRLNIRRPAGEPKYIGPAGWRNALYGADRLAPGRPAVLVEGEFDALTVMQHADDLAIAVATGSTAGGQRTRWIAGLAACSRVLVAFDGDEAGEKASAYWLSVLRGQARRWRAYYAKDANGLAQSGGAVREWVAAGLRGG